MAPVRLFLSPPSLPLPFSCKYYGIWHMYLHFMVTTRCSINPLVGSEGNAVGKESDAEKAKLEIEDVEKSR